MISITPVHFGVDLFFLRFLLTLNKSLRIHQKKSDRSIPNTIAAKNLGQHNIWDLIFIWNEISDLSPKSGIWAYFHKILLPSTPNFTAFSFFNNFSPQILCILSSTLFGYNVGASLCELHHFKRAQPALVKNSIIYCLHINNSKFL